MFVRKCKYEALLGELKVSREKEECLRKKIEDLEKKLRPDFRVVSEYDLKQDKDVFHIEKLQAKLGYSSMYYVYEKIYSGTNAECEKRLKRLLKPANGNI